MAREQWPLDPCSSGYIGTRPRGARDGAWRYAYEGPDPGSVICIKCEKLLHGDINCLKYHLAGIDRHDATTCLETNEEIKRQMNALLAAGEEKKLQRERAKLAMRSTIAKSQGVSVDIEEEQEAFDGIVGSRRGPRIRKPTTTSPIASASSSRVLGTIPLPSSRSGSIGDYFVPRNTLGAQPSLEAIGWNKEVHEKTDIAAADFWYFNNISFNVGDNPYWLNLVIAMSVLGKGYKAPSHKDLSGRLLTNAVARPREVMDQKIEWANYGCTILSDGWTNGKNRTIINFLVACKDNVVFLKSVDASNKVKNAETLARMLEHVVMEVGVENVVQIIIDNAATYVSAGRILQERHPTLFWTPCAAHVLDLLLEDIGKLEWVTPVVEDARRITKYIYNHPWVLNLMRQHTQGKDLVRDGVTRFATIFLTLQSLLAALTSLKQMFVSGEWLNSPYSKKPEGEVVACIVFDNQFAQRAAEIVKVSEPLVRVLRLVDGDKTPMGYLYEAMDRVKESIKNYYKGDRLKFDPIWEIVDRRWNNQLHQPIHAVGYFLNPRFRFGGSYLDPNGEVMKGLGTCIERMVPDVEGRELIVSELQNYEGGRGKLFSSELARRGRITQTPDAWWQNWGGNTPNLKKFAPRVLCQPCSSSNCERNWILFEAIHTKKRSKLA
ncbi:uncharacterized protein LOC131079406 isoform X2 [Cryptomeria japonica]|uniref:uncharacterized protein LOC131079406 isoform X2 n=1 Tax=Cryptomeria japonica TaxID=3369 RepID=UPI0027DA6D40|nr:uncharacterized protein LOC131079406 isoform X2 [Cryptomeria japonica]